MRHALLALALFFAGCAADPVQATRVLKAQGFTNIELGLYPWFMCAKGDDFNTAFTAHNMRGEKVQGAVCCGLFKACTVRFD